MIDEQSQNDEQQHSEPQDLQADTKGTPDAQVQEAPKQAVGKKRLWRRFRNLLLRILALAIVIYVLFFLIIGVTTMPSGDMYPRIDAGDLVLFYRLDKDVRAQDIIVLEKTIGDIQQAVDTNTIRPGSRTNAQSQDKQSVPQVSDTAPSEVVEDTSFLNKVNRILYDVASFLGFRHHDGARTYICRVVAAPGDTVEITDAGTLIVNGNAMIESNIFYNTTPYLGFTEYPFTLGEDECFVLADLRNGGEDSRFFGPVKTDEILGTVITIVRRNNL